MNRMALISRSLVPGSLPVLGLAPISLRANGHDPAEATRQRLLSFKNHMSCRHCASQLASFGRLLVFGPWAAQPSVESAGGMEVLPRWTAEGCAPAATSTTWPFCGTSTDCCWCRFEKQGHHTSLSHPLSTTSLSRPMSASFSPSGSSLRCTNLIDTWPGENSKLGMSLCTS